MGASILSTKVQKKNLMKFKIEFIALIENLSRWPRLQKTPWCPGDHEFR